MAYNTQAMPLITRSGTILIMLICTISSIKLGEAQTVASDSKWKIQKVTINLKQKSLDDLAALLTIQAGCNILIDGEPLLKITDLNFSGTAAQALDKIADVFDYTWKVSKGGIILLTKRFNNPEERPQMNGAELRQAAQDVVEALKALPSRPDCSLAECFGALAVTLTSQQGELLRSRHQLRIDELSPLQQNLARTAIYTDLLTQPLIKWQSLLEQLTNLPAAFVRIEETDKWLDLQGTQREKGLNLLFRSGDRSSLLSPAFLFPIPWQPLHHTQQKANR